MSSIDSMGGLKPGITKLDGQLANGETASLSSVALSRRRSSAKLRECCDPKHFIASECVVSRRRI